MKWARWTAGREMLPLRYASESGRILMSLEVGRSKLVFSLNWH